MEISKDIFLEEAHELLADLEEALMELESDPTDIETVGRVFRNMHTIKGSGAMYGFDEIAAFTHNIETTYDHIREKRLNVTSDIITLTLESCDQIKNMLAEPAVHNQSANRNRLEQAFIALVGSAPAPRKELSTKATAVATYRIRFKPFPGLFENGTNLLPLLEELLEMGEAMMVCNAAKLPPLAELDPTKCYLWWDIFLTTAAGLNAIKDVFIFVEDLSDLTIDEIDIDETRRLGEILLERGEITQSMLTDLLDTQKKIGKVMLEHGIITEQELQSTLAEQAHVRNQQRKKQAATASVRVASTKLDSLMDLVGELVIVQARLTQFSNQINNPDLVAIAEEVERLSAELRDNTMGIRMLPIGTTFARFKRLVRDLSGELNKQIDFETDGAETELDKNVIEKLGDPLVHLIRNSIDHGIESPEDRLAAGKSRHGRIKLSAQHAGAYVHITISDDGKGLDAERIRQKAISKGLLSADARIDDKTLFEMIFHAGFSTAQSVTSVSGRGVGMDVVASSIDSLGGNIDISSTPGVGTEIALKLPLTLAIIDGLLVQIGGDFFVLPLGSVIECIEMTTEDMQQGSGRNLARVREDLIPYIKLRDIFSITNDPPAIQQIVITEANEMIVGFVVDRVVGQHQTVIKNLGKALKDVDGISGATIMGDGTVALILDIPALIHYAEADELRTTGS